VGGRVLYGVLGWVFGLAGVSGFVCGALVCWLWCVSMLVVVKFECW